MIAFPPRGPPTGPVRPPRPLPAAPHAALTACFRPARRPYHRAQNEIRTFEPVPHRVDSGLARLRHHDAPAQRRFEILDAKARHPVPMLDQAGGHLPVGEQPPHPAAITVPSGAHLRHHSMHRQSARRRPCRRATCRSKSARWWWETRAYTTLRPVATSDGRSTRMLPEGVWCAGTGKQPCFHQRQAVTWAMPSRRAKSDSFIDPA